MPIHLLSAEMHWLRKAPWSPQSELRDMLKHLYVGDRGVGVQFMWRAVTPAFLRQVAY